MSGNRFSGNIPLSVGNLKMLIQLEVSENFLQGTIPSSLGQCNNRRSLQKFKCYVSYGNSKLCGGIPKLQLPRCTKNNSSNQKISRGLKVIVSIISAFSGLLIVSFFLFSWLQRRRKLRKQLSGPKLRKALPKVSYESLLKATVGFSSTHLIGVGSFGSVYKGLLDDDGTVVAIKVLNLQRPGASKSFMAECKALRNVRHRNLVRVITSCSSIDFQGNDFKALVYDYMPNGSLEKWLHPNVVPRADEEIKIQNLTLLQRISIAIDVASALDYLHHHCKEPILHCDLKPSNVLLDNDLTAHVGDFGLARFRQEISNPNQSSSLGVKGTIGYTAPEYSLGSEVSTNGDVYSYGKLLLEMVTGKKTTDALFEGDLNLHNFARTALPNHVIDIVDPILLNDDEVLTAINRKRRQQKINDIIECIVSMVRIGVAWSMETPQDRMNITNVIHELQSIKKILCLDPKPCSASKEVNLSASDFHLLLCFK
ncbi:protein kinase domain-containing protein [Citrus sinensis]|uniref:Protein kinase domain-containing protein n=1 Tax=Citrus sinensis TaxID=2711 RepID=A0ACB8L0W7_CITSI|nr:protein kinase domain-containing protein [Citrus sinensis]